VQRAGEWVLAVGGKGVADNALLGRGAEGSPPAQVPVQEKHVSKRRETSKLGCAGDGWRGCMELGTEARKSKAERLAGRRTGRELFRRHHPLCSRDGSFREGIEGFEMWLLKICRDDVKLLTSAGDEEA